MASIEEPLVFEPYLRPQIWGGRRLEALYHKRLPLSGDFGESWEISAHPHHVSRVAEGPLRGVLLTDLWRQNARQWTGRADPPDRFPLLVKLLDCRELLSIQVHPDDATAQRLLQEDWGKTEAWVVLAAEPSAKIYAGLSPQTTREVLEAHLDAGTTAECLHSFSPKTGDCLFLPAGVVHAVGGGVVMAEVQQSSDATFRLFDWNRLGPDGKPRALHRRESLAAIDWNIGPIDAREGTLMKDAPEGVLGRELVRCRYFVLERLQSASPFEASDEGRMSIWMTIEGQAELSEPRTGYRREFRAGETVLTPPTGRGVVWTPQGAHATLLRISLP